MSLKIYERRNKISKSRRTLSAPRQKSTFSMWKISNFKQNSVIVMLSLMIGTLWLTLLSKPSAIALNITNYGMSTSPKLFLWAWERPEQLEFIDPAKTGVAFLAKTIELQGHQVVTHPRLQPLKVPSGTEIIAVVRIETDRKERPILSEKQRTETVTTLAKAAKLPGITALQIDFDATVSERPFYRAVLSELRQQMPKPVALSITALASWCIGDPWISGLPIDEAVPMLFQMGVDDRWVKNYLKSGQDFRTPLCRHSNGVSTDESVARLNLTRRTYVFSPQAWSPSILKQYQRKVLPP
jgi:hypothetical protein